MFMVGGPVAGCGHVMMPSKCPSGYGNPRGHGAPESTIPAQPTLLKAIPRGRGQGLDQADGAEVLDKMT